MKCPSTRYLSSGNFLGLPFQEMSWEATERFCSLVMVVGTLVDITVLLTATVLLRTLCMKLPGVEILGNPPLSLDASA